MSQPPTHAHPAVALSLQRWHRMVADKDMGELHAIVHPQAVFKSPVAFTSYRSAQAVVLALSNVIQVFEDFTYHRQLSSDDGLDIVLEFSARIGDRQLRGVDLVRFDAQGLIREFEVMVRPMSGLQALAAEMGRRVADSLPAFKAGD